MIGERLAHYEVLDFLGKGGMGEVYRARDARLDREVALKVLPAAMAADPARLKRFEREARSLAGLNHPHIVTLYSVEEAGGVHFLTMELVEGESLDRTIPPGGLPLETVFRLGSGVADALAAAHEKGVVHRDLKPANVMVTADGRAKVLDFGLAGPPRHEAHEAEGGAEGSAGDSATQVLPLTREGTVMGTVPYMAPERLRGATFDHRSDIFSLGVLLYEMATGRRPFAGPSLSDVTSSILRDAPPPVSALKPELPRHLARIVARCLEKEPRKRAQSARDVRNELEALRDEVRLGSAGAGAPASAPAPAGPRPRTGRAVGLWLSIGAALLAVAALLALLAAPGSETGGPAGLRTERGGATPAEGAVDPRSIAVLPFADMSPGQDQEYFADGISEELLNLLAKIPNLRVAARTSSFAFKGGDAQVSEIARELRVAHLLEGSVRKAGDRVRITAQLIQAADGYHLWSETWDRTLDDIFAIQEEIAADVAEQLEITLLGEVPRMRETDPEAYSLYLQAVQLARRRTPEGLERSDTLLRRVLEIDPGYAPAWGQSAWNRSRAADLGLVTSDAGYGAAGEAARRALELDPTYAPAHATLAWIALTRDGEPAAARHLERAQELDPADGQVLGASAVLLSSLGRLEQAVEVQEYLAARDPLNPLVHYNLGLSYRWSGRLREAADSYRTVLRLSPGQGAAHYGLAMALLLQGETEAALEEIGRETSEAWRRIGLAMIRHDLGERAASDAALRSLIADYGRDAPYNIAYVLAYRGEEDRAFEWLDRAVEHGDPGLSQIVVEPLFDGLRDDPRWLPFLRRIGKSPDRLAAVEFEVTLPGR